MKWLSSLGLVGIAAAQLAPTTPPKGTQPNNLPALGLGTWYMRGTNATAAVSQAIVDGYRLIDCAYIYFNQQQVGAGINDGIKRAGIRREDLWVTSKVWNNRHADPQAALQETLTQLGLTYLDLYLVHWPMGNANGGGTQFDVVNTWKNMEKLPATKLTRFIGISNFNPSQVGELLRSATIKPKVHQIELHPYLAQTEFVRSLQASNITVQAYAPLANSNPNYSTRSRVTQILQHPTIKEIASARGCAPAQVVLGWNIKRGVSVIPKAVVSAHQRENLPTQQKCQLTAADEAKITALSQSQAYRFNAGPCATMAGACFTGLAKGT